MKNLPILSLLLVVLSLSLVSSLNIDFVSPTPGNGSMTNKTVLISANLTTAGRLANLSFTWQGDKIDLYDSNLVLHYNFDNNSQTGDNFTSIKDLSRVGNNGTIYGMSNISYSPGIYGNGINFSGLNNSAWITYTKPKIANTSNFTISIWIKPYPANWLGDYTTVLRFSGYSALRWYNNSLTSGYCDILLHWINKSGASVNPTLTSSGCPVGNWTHYLIVRRGNNFSEYINGVYKSSASNTGIYEMNNSELSETFSDYKIGYSSSYPQSNSMAFNGTIDELMVWNRSLSDNEIELLYSSQVTRFNDTRYQINFNISNLANIRWYNYSVFANDTIGQNQSPIYHLYVNSISKLNIYTTKLIGNIVSSFYGANTHFWSLMNGTLIDTNSDNTRETLADTSWHRTKWLDAKMGIQRSDMYLSTYYYFTIRNKKFDLIKNVSYLDWNGSGTCNNIIEGVCFSTYGTGGNFSQILSLSNDNHTGSYSLNITVNGTSPSGRTAFVYWVIDSMPSGYSYNFTAWIKSSNSTTVRAGWNDGAIVASSNTSVGDGTWKLVSVNWTSNGTYTSMRISVEADRYESFLIDDVEIYKDNKAWESKNINDMKNITEVVDWAKANNQRINLIADRPIVTNVIPYNCMASRSYYNTYCNGLINYTEWYLPTIRDWLNVATRNGTNADIIDLEITNEPYFYYNWLGNISYDEHNGSVEYVRLYNISYNYLKPLFPTISIGGPSGFRMAPNLTWAYLSNMTKSMDFVAIHPYGYTKTDALQQYTDIKNLYTNCSLTGANCTRIIATEWSVGDTTMKNTSIYYPAYANSWAQVYESILNSYPANISLEIYQWSERYKYDGISNYNEYPSKWHMVSEPALDNELTSGYNITKQFGSYHPGGATVVNSTSDYLLIKVVSSKLGNNYAVTVINTDTDSVNLTINASGVGNYLTPANGLNKGTLILVNNTIAQLGVQESYDVNTYITPNLTLLEGTGLRKQDYLGNVLATSNNEVWFSKSTDDSKHIASNLTNTINATVSFDVATCDNIGTINYRSNTSTYVFTLHRGQYMCTNNVVTISNVPLEPAKNSNEFDIYYDSQAQTLCEGTIGGISKVIWGFGFIFLVVIIGGVVFIVMSGTLQFDNIMSVALGVLVSILIAVMFVSLLASNLTGGC